MATSKTWPGGAVGASPTSYSIPASGDLNWATLSTFLSALADGAQSTTFQKYATRRVTTSPVSVSATADCIIITDLTVPGPVAVSLPPGSHKQILVIIDGKGDAATNTVTVTPAGADTISGAASLAFQNNRESLWICFDSATNDWVILGRFTSSVPLANPMTAPSDLILGGVGGVPAKLAVGAANTVLTSNGTTASWQTRPLVTNALVDPAAAIAGTKVSPNFGAQDITTTGRVGVGIAPAGGASSIYLRTTLGSPAGLTSTEFIDKSAVRFHYATAANSHSLYISNGGSTPNSTTYIQNAANSGTSAIPISLNPFGGNVGIATAAATPAAALDVVRSGGSDHIRLERTGNSVGTTYIGSANNSLYFGTTAGGTEMCFMTASTATFPSVGLPAVAPINSGTNTSNILVNYQEGAWTPLVTFATQGTATQTSNVGLYTRIGRIVYFSLNMQITVGTGTGAFTISGLPFTAAGQAGSGMLTSSGNITLGANCNYVFVIIAGQTKITIYSFNNSTGVASAVTNTMFGANPTIGLCGWYSV